MPPRAPRGWNRRGFLRLSGGGLLAASSGLALPGMARAGAGGELKFIFVVNYGGWDITRVFAREFDNPLVDMEADAGETTAGGITFVDHDDRPSVRTFFQRQHSRTVILNGMLISSIAHENCMRITMTGSTAQDAPDWPAILAGTRAADFALPHVVVAGPSYPGDFGAYVTRTGSSGQLAGLLSGSILEWSDTPVSAPDWRLQDSMDSYLARRAAAYADATAAEGGRLAELSQAFSLAAERGRSLKDLSEVVNWSGGTAFGQQLDLAVDLLKLGVARCVSVSSGYAWDTHTDNDATQSNNFESLFGELNALMDMLQATPGQQGGSLADETMVVVCSEMGRTPALNATDGKDHWPYGSALLCGPGITGDRVIGGFDSYFYGQEIDLASGELADGSAEGSILSADTFGATLLALAGLDPQDYRSGVSPLEAIIA